MTESPFEDKVAPVATPKPVRPRDEKGRIIARTPMNNLSELPVGPEPAPAPAALSEQEELHRLRMGQMRKPLSQRAKRLDYPPIPGFHTHWIVDLPGRMAAARQSGYVNVEENGQPVSEHAGTDRRGDALRQYLMKTPDEFYNADDAVKQERRNVTDRQIYAGTHKQEAGDNRYVPKGGIKIESRRGRQG